MAIIRAKVREFYVVISKVSLEDTRLSWKARGLHAYLMTKPDNWNVVVRHLETQSIQDGRESVTTALQELEHFGYIRRNLKRGQGGKFDTSDCEIFEFPGCDETPDGTSYGFPVIGLPVSGKPVSSKDLVLVNTDREVKKEAKVSIFSVGSDPETPRDDSKMPDELKQWRDRRAGRRDFE